ncbi:MAG: type II secretion system protein [Kiritimatiellae bacterium]|nr:type II secretion system protein [Kiritimatiellia bacterium]
MNKTPTGTHRSVKQKQQGFGLLELPIVVAVLGILAVISIPAVQEAVRRSQDGRFCNNLRVLTDTAIAQYALEHGDYPRDAPPGVLPRGMENYLPKKFSWSAPTPIGGKWDWNRAVDRTEGGEECYASIGVWSPDRTTRQMESIDRMIDDGNLTSGRFRAATNGYYWCIE